jgi:hypothetical protein
VQSSAKMLSDAIGLATVRAGRAFGIPTNATAYWNRRFAKGARHAGLTHSPGISNDYCTVRMRMPVATSRAREEMGECFALGFRFALIGPAGSLAATTTHALLAGKVQRKVLNGVAGLAAGGASLDRQKSRQFVPYSDCRSMANAC